MNPHQKPKKSHNLVHEDRHGRSVQSDEDKKDLEDNKLQGSLTGQSEDQEDVSGDLAGNAAGNSEE